MLCYLIFHIVVINCGTPVSSRVSLYMNYLQLFSLLPSILAVSNVKICLSLSNQALGCILTTSPSNLILHLNDVKHTGALTILRVRSRVSLQRHPKDPQQMHLKQQHCPQLAAFHSPGATTTHKKK